MKIKLIIAFVFLLFTGRSNYVFASHIVGGEMTYKCLGQISQGFTRYQIRLDIYQDCLNGLPQAIAQDNPAFITIFNMNGSAYIVDSVYYNNYLIVPPNFSNSCITNPPTTCLRKETFIKNYDLPNNNSGFIVAYQRCCRNASIVNIVTPDAVGATYFCIIPPVTPTSTCNNSAVFKNYPPQIICINNPLVYDHSATDADGDSLSYELCESYVGGSNQDPKPYPFPPPYSTVLYSTGFSAIKPMAGNPQIQINPVTGVITGTPNLLGRFVVTVCCNEWRNQQIINTVKREFQFVVTNCSKAVVANIPQYSQEFNTYVVDCKDYTVHFDNLSTGGFSYSWDFGVPNMTSDTSNQFSPTFTYPDTGTYVVKLVVNKGTTCPDSITRFVKVYPVFHTDYTFSGLPCPHSPIQFNDSSYGSLAPISWYWNFDDSSAIASIPNPVHTFDSGGIYKVALITKNSKGCIDTAVKDVSIEHFKPFAGNDTVIVKGESIDFNAQGGIDYTWTPGTNLSATDIPNPVGYYPNIGEFDYNVHIKSIGGCEGDDSIKVWVVNQSSLFVPTGFTPNGDGRNETLQPFGVGYRNINYFRVFNRWGQQVFYTTKFKEGWDGTWKGVPQDIGTYYWILSITNRFGKEEIVKGNSELIR